MNESEFAELAAGQAMHALSDADERRLQAALREHPEWIRYTEDYTEAAALLAAGTTPELPPSWIRDDLLARIVQTPQGPVAGAAPDADTPALAVRSTPGAEPPEPDGTSEQGPDTSAPDGTPEPGPDPSAPGSDKPEPDGTSAPARKHRPGRMLFALAACLVLVAGLGIGAATLISQYTRPAAVVALEAIEHAPDAQQKSAALAAGGTATAHWSVSENRAVLVTDGLRPLSETQTYELWFVRGDTPVSAGTFSAATGTTTALLHGPMRTGDAIAVTVEKAGGSATGAPTSTPILVIPTS